MRTGHAARRLWRSALPAFLLAVLVSPAQAGQVAIATAPLFNAAISLVKPNLLFILDDSSSMDYNYLPDEVPWDIIKLANPNPQTDTHAVALTSSQCNGAAYNPAVVYTPPVYADGTSFPNATFPLALNNGFDLNSPKTSLTNQFYYRYNWVTGDPDPLSYTYSNGVADTSTLFYRQCNSPNPPTTYAAKFTKVTITAVSAERQNYANWWSYYRKRLLMMKTVAGQSFKTLDSSFRVGLSTLHDTGVDDSPTFLPISDFNASQKNSFYAKLYTLGASASTEPIQFTPSRGALSKAGRYFAGKFFQNDGTAADALRDPMQYSCQQNFTLLASDGYWNSANDNGDGVATNFGPFGLDNFTPVGNQDGAGTGTVPPMFEGNYLSGQTADNTLADVAMYYYKTDLRHPGNGLPDTCTSGATGANMCPGLNADPPDYAPNVPTTADDDNNHPHMTTLTVGLAINGLLGYKPTYQTDGSGDYWLISHGNLNWPDPSTTTSFPYAATKTQVIERVDDLWHTAVNGRGTYFNANDPATLVNALKAAIGGVANRLGYTAAATSSLAPIDGNNSLFVASYITGQWTGNVLAESIVVTGPNAGEVDPTLKWCVEPIQGECDGQLEAQVHPASDDRAIYFNKSGALTTFKYAQLPAGQQAYFDNTKLSQYAGWSASDKATATGDTFVDYLRGQSQYEIEDGNTHNLYRMRVATLGDIVDSQPLYVGDPFYQYADPGYAAFKAAKAGRAKTVLVAGNDGMLHAINAITGQERWAFVPTAVMPKMYWLADTSYASHHHNYVNGRLVWSDVCFANCTDAATADWHTILMGALNGGARGYYALDVTNPASPTMLWEFTASATDPNLGYSFGNPLAVKKSDGTWVVAVASGYDNGTKDSDGSDYPAGLAGDGRGVLYLLNPQTGAVLDRYYTTDDPTPAAPVGLARMAYFADNPEQNATALYAYGGDLAGNLWRFDINKNPNAAGAVVKLATFRDGGASPQPQPITTRVEMTKVGTNRMIFVATGKYLEQSDLTNVQTQSLYAIIDKGETCATSSPPCTVSDRDALAQRRLVDHKADRTRTVEAVSGDPAAGWFLDFPDLGTGGGSERNNVDMILAIGTLVVPTNVPTDEICNASGYSWINFLDFKTGLTVGGVVTSSAATLYGNDLTTGINAIWIGGSPEIIRTGNASGPTKVRGVTFAGVTAGVVGHRVGWREIFPK